MLGSKDGISFSFSFFFLAAIVTGGGLKNAKLENIAGDEGHSLESEV